MSHSLPRHGKGPAPVRRPARRGDHGGLLRRCAVEALEARQLLSGSTPFSGTPVSLPGAVQAENYDLGGEGVAFHSPDGVNHGGAFRSDGVSIEPTTDAGGGYDVGWTGAGEWLNYSVNAASAASYVFTFRVASSGPGGTFHLEDEAGNSLTGELGVPDTGGWQTYTSVAAPPVSLTAGDHVLKLVMDSGGASGYAGNFNDFTAVDAPPDAPTGLAVIGTPGQVALSWSPPAGVVSGYNVYRSTTPGGEGATPVAAGVTGTSYTDTGLANDGTVYYYTVAAVNAAGEGAQSAEASSPADFHSAPFGGTPSSLPGTVQVEDYDLGGEGVALHSPDGVNYGGAYRNDGVSVEPTTDAGGGYDVGWTRPGEWLGYTVNVTAAGSFDMSFRVASSGQGGTFHLTDRSGANLTGELTVPDTGGWQNFTSVNASEVSLTAGTQVLKLVMDSAGGSGYLGNFDSFAAAAVAPPTAPTGLAATGSLGQVALSWSAPAGDVDGYAVYRSTAPGGQGGTPIATVTSTSYTDSTVATDGTLYYYTVQAANAAGAGPQSAEAGATGAYTGTPFGGTPTALPGRVEAEEFDSGGEGVAYHNLGDRNQGGAFRSAEGVGIEATGDVGGGYDVGWTSAGEWLKYTVNVTVAGPYDVTFRVASAGSGGTFHLEDAAGNDLTGALTVPDTGGWQNFTDVVAPGVTLPVGVRTLKLLIDTAGPGGYAGNFNAFNVSPTLFPGGVDSVTATPLSESSVELSWRPAPAATAYQIERSVAGGVPSVLATLPGGTTDFIDATLDPGSEVAYTVTPTSAAGSGSSGTIRAMSNAAGTDSAYLVTVGAPVVGSTGGVDTGALTASVRPVVAGSPVEAIWAAVFGSMHCNLGNVLGPGSQADYPFAPNGAYVVRRDNPAASADGVAYGSTNNGLTQDTDTGAWSGYIGLEDEYAFRFGGRCDLDFNDVYYDVKAQPQSVDLEIKGVASKDKNDIGGFVGLNANDDNGSKQTNDIPARRDFDPGVNPVPKEHDLLPVSLNVTATAGSVRLSQSVIAGDQGQVAVWDSATKQHQIQLPMTWKVGTQPTTVYVEGLTPSSEERDISLQLALLDSDGNPVDGAIDGARLSVTPILKQFSIDFSKKTVAGVEVQKAPDINDVAALGGATLSANVGGKEGEEFATYTIAADTKNLDGEIAFVQNVSVTNNLPGGMGVVDPTVVGGLTKKWSFGQNAPTTLLDNIAGAIDPLYYLANFQGDPKTTREFQISTATDSPQLPFQSGKYGSLLGVGNGEATTLKVDVTYKFRIFAVIDYSGTQTMYPIAEKDWSLRFAGTVSLPKGFGAALFNPDSHDGASADPGFTISNTLPPAVASPLFNDSVAWR